jgi:hypothetical protein
LSPSSKNLGARPVSGPSVASKETVKKLGDAVRVAREMRLPVVVLAVATRPVRVLLTDICSPCGTDERPARAVSGKRV